MFYWLTIIRVPRCHKTKHSNFYCFCNHLNTSKHFSFHFLFFLWLQVQPSNYVCRTNTTECDVPEYCDGETGQVSDSHFIFFMIIMNNWDLSQSFSLWKKAKRESSYTFSFLLLSIFRKMAHHFLSFIVSLLSFFICPITIHFIPCSVIHLYRLIQ